MFFLHFLNKKGAFFGKFLRYSSHPECQSEQLQTRVNYFTLKHLPCFRPPFPTLQTSNEFSLHRCLNGADFFWFEAAAGSLASFTRFLALPLEVRISDYFKATENQFIERLFLCLRLFMQYWQLLKTNKMNYFHGELPPIMRRKTNS